MESVVLFIGFITRQLGDLYPLLVSVSSCISSAVTLVLSIFIKKFKKMDKTLLLILTIFSYLTCEFKVCLDLLNGSHINGKLLLLSTILRCVSFFLLSVSIFLSKSIFLRKTKNNQPIDGFVKLNQPYKYTDFSENELYVPEFRKVTFLKTDKMFNGDTNDNFGVNYSQILSFISQLKEKELNVFEKEELSTLESQIVKLAHTKVSNFDRHVFSSNLSKLFKLMGKYSVDG